LPQVGRDRNGLGPMELLNLAQKGSILRNRASLCPAIYDGPQSGNCASRPPSRPSVVTRWPPTRTFRRRPRKSRLRSIVRLRTPVLSRAHRM